MAGAGLLLPLCSLLLLTTASTDPEPGLCTIDKEADCAGDSEEMKQNYTKIKWTDDYDYNIKDELDAADDTIAKDRQLAIEMFQKILESHPESSRARYAMARVWQIMMIEANTTEERTDYCDKSASSFKLVLSGRDVKEFLYVSAASHLLQITETSVCTGREDHIHALRVLTAHAPGERYATVLCQEMFLAGQYAEAEAEIEQIVQDKPEEFILNLLKTTILKLNGHEKEANKYLRDIDFDEAMDKTNFTEEQLINIKAVMINDINYLILTLTRENKEDIANILIKDASKLHLVPSRHQRPLLYKPDLRTQAVWPLAELRALNRWTNKQSITGVGKSSDKLKYFQENIEKIKKESQQLATDLDEWIKDTQTLTKTGEVYTRGLYLYTKKKHETCSHAQTTCKLVKTFKDSSACKKCVSKFVMLKAGTRQLPHVGYSNEKLRAILPVTVAGQPRLVVGDREEILKENELVVIDNSFENAVINDTEGDLTLLVVDFHHPDLSDRNKNAGNLSDIMKKKFLIY